MEQLEPLTKERLLVYENTQEIEVIKSQAEMRAGMLNSIARHKLSPEEIRIVSSSKTAIAKNLLKG